VSDVAAKGGVLEFTRLDEGLPFNYGTFYGLNYRYVPVPDELNRYLLRVTNLPQGRYEVVADGRSAGTFTAAQLTAGVNIASTTPDPWQPGGPWAAQGDMLHHLTEARHQVAVAKSHTRVFLPTAPATAPFGDQADAGPAAAVPVRGPAIHAAREAEVVKGGREAPGRGDVYDLVRDPARLVPAVGAGENGRRTIPRPRRSSPPWPRPTRP
jgi:hypothetical protein